MKPVRLLALAGLLPVLLVMLTAARAPEPSPRWPLADEALVYVYHVKTPERDGRVYWMKIDGRNVAKLDVSEHSWVYVKPGAHVVTSRAPLDPGVGESGTTWPLEFEGGKVYYLRFTSSAKPPLAVNGQFTGRAFAPAIPVLIEMTRENARIELLRSHYRAPEAGWPLTR